MTLSAVMTFEYNYDFDCGSGTLPFVGSGSLRTTSTTTQLLESQYISDSGSTLSVERMSVKLTLTLGEGRDGAD